MGEHISFVVNGTPRELDVEPRRLLVQAIREDLDLTGTHVGCDTSQCGACTVHVDGLAVKSCTMLAVQADGSEIKTIEGLANGDELHPLQAAFWEKHGLQCGFCTPGMIMTAVDLLSRNPDPTDDEIRHAIEGNYCRCTGYQNIVAAIRSAAEQLRTRRRKQHRRRGDGLGAGGRDDHRRPWRIDQAGRGSALHHRQRQLSRRHQAAIDGPHGHPAQPLRARQHPLDRYSRGEGHARCDRGHRWRRHPVQPVAHGLAGRWRVRASRTTSTPRASWPPTTSSGPARAWRR